MRTSFAIIASVAAATCAGNPRLELETYFTRPPLDAPLHSREDLLGAYGLGCVRVEPNAEGVPHLEHHGYFDPSSGYWVEAFVEVRGPAEAVVVGVLLSAKPPCTDAPQIRRTFVARSIRGLKPGNSINEVIRRLGPPLRVGSSALGDLDDVDVLEYYPNKLQPEYSIRFYVENDVVVAVAAVITE